MLRIVRDSGQNRASRGSRNLNLFLIYRHFLLLLNPTLVTILHYRWIAYNPGSRVKVTPNQPYSVAEGTSRRTLICRTLGHLDFALPQTPNSGWLPTNHITSNVESVSPLLSWFYFSSAHHSRSAFG